MVESSPANRIADAFSAPPLSQLSEIGCDAFERALLPIIRDIAVTCYHPERQSWLPVYGMAEQLWGARTGLPLVHGLAQIVTSLVRIKGEELEFLSTEDEWTAQMVTSDEQLLLLMLHHLRRQHVNAGYDFLMDLVDAEMDEDLMQEALDFAERHSCGQARARRHDGVAGSMLRVVS